MRRARSSFLLYSVTYTVLGIVIVGVADVSRHDESRKDFHPHGKSHFLCPQLVLRLNQMVTLNAKIPNFDWALAIGDTT